MFYNASWQLVEEEIYEDWSSGTPGSVDERRAYVWGARYIDDLVQTLVDGHNGATPDGDYEDVSGGDDIWFFHLHDAQFSVVAVMDAVGGLLERITYDAYSEARHHDWRDVDGDGDYDATDRGIIASIPFQGYPITNANYNADADLNRDGVVNITDVTLSTTTYPTPLAKGELSYAHVGGRFGYDGYRFDPERREYKVRHRDYSPVLMRWMQRDPAGYVDGMGVYGFALGNPNVHTDPAGLWTIERNYAPGALATSECGDTIRSLADMIGLEVESFRQWATPPSGEVIVGFEATGWSWVHADSEFIQGQQLMVPNTIVAYWGGDLGGIGRRWVNWSEQVQSFWQKGYYVDEIYADGQPNRFSNLLNLYAGVRALHGAYFWGHGDTRGLAVKREGVFIDELDYAKAALPYKLSIAHIYACDSNAGKDSLFSSNGESWIGFSGTMVPVRLPTPYVPPTSITPGTTTPGTVFRPMVIPDLSGLFRSLCKGPSMPR